MLELSQRSHKSLLALGPFPSLQSRNFAGLININGTCCSMLQRVVAASWNQSINQIFRDQVACITFSVIPKIIVKNSISKCETCKNMTNAKYFITLRIRSVHFIQPTQRIQSILYIKWTDWQVDNAAGNAINKKQKTFEFLLKSVSIAGTRARQAGDLHRL